MLTYGIAPIAAIGSALLVPVVLVGAEFAFPRTDRSGRTGSGRYRVLPLLYVPLQLVVTGWALWLASQPYIDALEFLSLCLSIG